MDLVVVQDLFLNETAGFARVFLPGASFLEKDGTFANAERRVNRVRAVMKPKTGKHEWQIVCEIATALGDAFARGGAGSSSPRTCRRTSAPPRDSH